MLSPIQNADHFFLSMKYKKNSRTKFNYSSQQEQCVYYNNKHRHSHRTRKKNNSTTKVPFFQRYKHTVITIFPYFILCLCLQYNNVSGNGRIRMFMIVCHAQQSNKLFMNVIRFTDCLLIYLKLQVQQSIQFWCNYEIDIFINVAVVVGEFLFKCLCVCLSRSICRLDRI